MKFRQVTATKYIGSDGYSLHQARDGRYSIFKGSAITKWGTGFKTVRAAEIFLENHDYIHATTDTISLSADDIEFAENVYGLEPGRRENELERDGVSVEIEEGDEDSSSLWVKIRNKGKIFKAYTADDLFLYLDKLFPEDAIFASITCRGAELRPILAAKGKRNPKEITKNLIRVKSSNIWAYGVEIKDNDVNVGDVYVQFKGKNGGPADVYRYYDVPISLWRKFIGAPSKGHFLWKYLRNNFLYSKLTGDKRGKLKNAVN